MKNDKLSIWALIVLFSLHIPSILWAQTAGDAEPNFVESVKRIGHKGQGGEAYFSPDGSRLIYQGEVDKEEITHTYTVNLDGDDLLRINNIGQDACSYYFPSGERIIWTSSRDHPDMPQGNPSDPQDYPQGFELYTSKPDGSDVIRLTHNQVYDAEVSVSPDGEWVLFTRQIEGALDLWRMRPDGSDPLQITHTADLQEGGAFYLPDSKTIIYRAWDIKAEGQRGMPMGIFTILHDGSQKKEIINDGKMNWSPFPAPDGLHFVFVKMLPPHNFEIFLGSIDGAKPIRLTYNDAFDAFPAISPDGQSMAFTSSRGAGEKRAAFLYTMDISALDLGAKDLD